MYLAASAVITLFAGRSVKATHMACIQHTPPLLNRNRARTQYLERRYLPQREAKTNTNPVPLVWNLTPIDAKPRSAGSKRMWWSAELSGTWICAAASRIWTSKKKKPESDGSKLLCCCVRQLDGAEMNLSAGLLWKEMLKTITYSVKCSMQVMYSWQSDYLCIFILLWTTIFQWKQFVGSFNLV